MRPRLGKFGGKAELFREWGRGRQAEQPMTMHPLSYWQHHDRCRKGNSQGHSGEGGKAWLCDAWRDRERRRNTNLSQRAWEPKKRKLLTARAF